MGLIEYLRKRKLKAREKEIKTLYAQNKSLLPDMEIIKQGGYYVIIRVDRQNRQFFLGKFKTLLETMDYFNKIAQKRSSNDH